MKKVMIGTLSLLLTTVPVLSFAQENSSTEKSSERVQKESSHTFTLVETGNLSETEQAFIDQVKEEAGIYRQGELVVISLGEKPNTGYQLEFVEQKVTNNKTSIYVKAIEPSNDPAVSYLQVLTYPVIVGKIDETATIEVIDKESNQVLFEDKQTEEDVTHKFQSLTFNELSETEQAFVEKVRVEEGVHQQGDLYVVSLGQKPSAGYGIEFVEQKDSWEQTFVYVKTTEPKEGEMVAEVLTYPVLIGKINLPPYTTISFIDEETNKPLFQQKETTNQFTLVKSDELTEGEQSFVEKMKHKEGVHQQGDLFVISLGEKPNTGYGIEFIEQKNNWDQTIIYVKTNEPKEGEMYAQVITYPALVGKMNVPAFKTVNVVDVDTEKPLFEQDLREITFKDIKKGFWAGKEIAWAAKHNMFPLKNNSKFNPNQPISSVEFLVVLKGLFGMTDEEIVTYNLDLSAKITRGQFAQIMAGKLGNTTDLKSSVNWLFETGITTGRFDDEDTKLKKFSPNSPLTRAQAVVFMYRMVENGILD